MTKLAVCTVYDTVANMYGSPFCALSAAVAIREIQSEMSNPSHRGPMQTHPQDYRLFQLGTFDNDTGRYDLFPQPEFLFQGTAPDRPVE